MHVCLILQANFYLRRKQEKQGSLLGYSFLNICKQIFLSFASDDCRLIQIESLNKTHPEMEQSGCHWVIADISPNSSIQSPHIAPSESINLSLWFRRILTHKISVSQKTRLATYSILQIPCLPPWRLLFACENVSDALPSMYIEALLPALTMPMIHKLAGCTVFMEGFSHQQQQLYKNRLLEPGSLAQSINHLLWKLRPVQSLEHMLKRTTKQISKELR